MTADRTDASPAARHQRWCQRRLAELDAPQGWPGLIGLIWLEPGDNAVGAGADCLVRLPDGPERLGLLRWQGTSITWEPAGGGVQALQTDAQGEPTPVRSGTYQFFIIEREGRLAVRLRDLEWQAKRPFAGLECLPYAPAWSIEAAWETLAEPVTMEVPTVTGELKAVTVRHRAVFDHAGQTVALLPMETGEEGVFFVFRDAGSGRLTYGAGRFLRCPPPQDGKVLLDFNRAYNPPCAFTPFATCPLPPPENWLGFAVEAGELKYRGGH